MQRIINIGLIAISLLLTTASARTRPAKERLTHDLLREYQSHVDPGTTHLELGVMALCFKFDKFTGIATGNVWEYMQWNDTRLSWNPEHYSGVDTLRIPSKLVWTPDIKLYSALWHGERETDANAVVKSDGTVLWIPRATYRTYCTTDGEHATCKFKLGSWTFDGSIIVLKPRGTDPLDLSSYDEACPSVISSHTATVVNHTYPCCQEPYPSLDVTLKISPR
jgi:hypothetical protein